MLKKFALSFFVLMFTAHLSSAQDFADEPIEFESMEGLYGEVAWIDLDRDGDLDALVANWVEKISVFRNDSGVMSALGDALNGEPFGYTDDFITVDFDGNGYIDLLLTNGMGKVDVLLNNGNFEFTVQHTGIDFVATRTSRLASIDIDSDADLDIIVDGKIFLNTDGVFTESIIPLPEDVTDYVWGDLNNDGLLDFVHIYYSTLVPYLATGDGVFQAKDQFASIRNDGEFSLVDADGDGDLDMIVAESTYGYAIFKNQYKQTGVVSFSRGYTFPASGGSTKITSGDSNLDGLVDFLVYGYIDTSLRTVILENTSTASQLSFTTNNLQIGEEVTTSLNFVDFDRDGDLDVHLSSSTLADVYGDHKVFLNQQTSSIVPPPSVPTGISTLATDVVKLSWTAQPKTVYQVEIMHNGEVRFPSVSLADGTLMIKAPATLHLKNEWTLTNLPAGSYQWRVQTIDQAQRSSAFTSWENFTVANAPHTLSLQSADFTDITLSWLFDEGTPDAFHIYRRSDTEAWTKIGQVTGAQLSYNDNTLVTNKRYEYGVRAVSGASASARSAAISWYTGQFTEREFARVTPNFISGSAGVADLDGDLDYDFQFIGRVNSGNEKAMDNNGAGAFTLKSYLPATDWSNPYTRLLYLGDMDSDGDTDMCILTGDSFQLKIALMTNNAGVFTRTFQSSQLIREFLDIEVKDFNNDGLTDVFYESKIASWGVAEYHFLFQERDGTFRSEELTIGTGATTEVRYFKVVDVNNDGFLDLYFTGTSYPTRPALLAINHNGNTFELKETTIFSRYDIHFQDFNGDGNIDLMYPFSDNRLVMHAGSGGETFGDPVFMRAFYMSSEMKIQSADLDFDGWPELLIHDDYNVGVMKGTGAGSFEPASFVFPGKWGSRLLLTDLEGDGDVDFMRMGNDSQHQGLNSLFENQWAAPSRTNTAPSAPASVSSTTTTAGVTFSWDMSTDDTTPPKLITYNLEVTDSNGKIWFSSGTNAAASFRNVFGPGNVGARTTFTVTNLPAGEYTAKVQSCDASFKLSSWSSGHAFTILPGPAELAVERILLNKIKLSWTVPPSGHVVVIERKTSSSLFEEIARLPEGTTTFTDTNLDYNTVYTYRAIGVADDVPTAASNAVSWNTSMWEIKSLTLPNVQTAMDVGDVTDDGRMDIMLAGYIDDGSGYWPRVKAIFENGEAGFTQRNFGETNTPNPVSANLSDFNNDARLDLYEHGYASGYRTNVFKNNGDKSFSSFSNRLSQENLEVMSYLDYDKDNDLDMYVVSKPSSGMYSARMLQNTSAGYENTTVLSKTCSSCSFYLTPGDFDRDGDEDVFNNSTLYLNTPDGLIATGTTLDFPLTGKLHTLDFNGDGWLDVIFLSSDAHSTASRLYRNNGLNAQGILQFERLALSLPGSAGAHLPLNAADFDHDGDLDLLFVAGAITFYSNNGNDTFTVTTLPKFSSSGQSMIIDYDLDGDLDVLFTGFMSDNGSLLYSTTAKLLENNLIEDAKGTYNNQPSPPANLRSHQDEDGVHLVWDAGDDDLTPAAALTYDVILYKDGAPIQKSNIIPATGARTKLARGRSILKSLLNLPMGSYEWKVQAVDQAYRGSVFTALQAINVLPSPPRMNDTVIYRCGRTIVLNAQGQNIQWYADREKTNLIASGTYSPTATQTVFVTQTISGVQSAPAEVVITITERPAAPALLHPSELYYCAEDHFQFYLQASGQNLQWYGNANLTTVLATGNNFLVETEPTSFYVTQTIQNCQSLPAQVTVSKIDIDERITYHDGKLTAQEQGAYYQWYYNGNMTNGTERTIEIGNTSGVYIVAIYKNGCYEVSDPFVVTGLEEESSPEVSAFPNPAQESVTISGLTGFSSITIFNVNGSAVFTQQITLNELTIPVNPWPPGFYLIEVQKGDTKKYSKLLVNH